MRKESEPERVGTRKWYASVPQRESDLESLPSYHTFEDDDSLSDSKRSRLGCTREKKKREREMAWEKVSISGTSHQSL